MKKTPLMKLIDWIYMYPTSCASSNEIITKATELLAEEREVIEKAWNLSRRDIDYPASGFDYFTQTYGGSDE